MIINFDIDDTLIPYLKEFEVEKKNLISKLTDIDWTNKILLEIEMIRNNGTINGLTTS